MMRFTLKTSLLVLGLVAFFLAAYLAFTRGTRKRQAQIAELTEMGAYHVGFNENDDVDTAYFYKQIDLNGIEKYVALKHVDFTDSDLQNKDLRPLINLGSLNYLELDGTHVTDDGLHAIARIKHLAVLDISRTHVTDACVQHIASIGGLRGVIVSDTMITSDGVALLKTLRPDVWVKQSNIGEVAHDGEPSDAPQPRNEAF
jgi:hypothetical protein